jgi:hypothetical protein
MLSNKVTLSTGHGQPHDRQFALALSDTPFDPAEPKSLPNHASLF